tara:strand:- start:164 stop:442 length:279 start_codon:yes stop_codon:yes gene_type:complete
MSKVDEKKIEFKATYKDTLLKIHELGSLSLLRLSDLEKDSNVVERAIVHVRAMKEASQMVADRFSDLEIIYEEYEWEKERVKNFSTSPAHDK